MTTRKVYAYSKVTNDGTHWGLIDTAGNYVVPTIFYNLYEWKEGMLRISKKKSDVSLRDGNWLNLYNGQYGFINHQGEFINNTYYDYALDFKEEYAAVVKNNRWGFISKNGKLVIDYFFQKIFSFQEGFCAAQLNDKWGFIDKKGNWSIEPVYDSVQSFNHRLAVVEKAGCHFIINRSGDIITETPKSYPWVVVKSENIILYGTTCGDIGQRNYGFMDIGGNIKTDPVFFIEDEYFFDLYDFSEGLLIVSNEEEEYGYLDSMGDLVIPCQFEEASPFENGYAVVTKDGVQYLLDKEGSLLENKIHENSYFDEALDFNEGLAAARFGAKWGFINEQNEVVIDFTYRERLGSFSGSEGLFFSEYNPKFNSGLLPIIKVENDIIRSGFIDKNGEQIISFDYMFVKPFEEAIT